MTISHERSGESADKTPFFNFESHYNLHELYRSKARRAEMRPSTLGASIDSSVCFFWDSKANQLINPKNLAADPTTVKGDYKLLSSVYNFHPSAADLKTLVDVTTNNVQLTFQALAADSFGEEFQWVVMAGLNMVSQYFGGSDGQSVSLSGANSGSNNLTDFTPSEQIIIVDGLVSLWVGLAAQQKDGWWDDFLKLIGMITNSPVFALVPMPKLAADSVKALTQLLNQVEQQNKLIPILNGNRVDFRLWDDASSGAPFVLRSGFWVVMDYNEASNLMDYKDKENIKNGIFLDFGDMQYDLKDSNNANQSIDATYAVIKFSVTPYKAS